MLQPLTFMQVQSARIYNGRFVVIGLFVLHLLLNFFLYGWHESEWYALPVTLLVGAIVAYFWNWQFGIAVGLGLLLSRLSWFALRYVYDVNFDSPFFVMPALWPTLFGFGAWYIADALYVRFRTKRPNVPADIQGFSLLNGLFIAVLLGLSLTMNGYVQRYCGISDPIRYMGGCLRSLEVGRIGQMAFSANGEVMVIEDGGDIDVRRVSDGAYLGTGFRVFPGTEDLALSRDGQVLANVSENRIRVWRSDADQLQDSFAFRTDEGVIDNIDLSPDGTLIAAELYDTLRIWRVADGSMMHDIPLAEPTEEVVFSPDGKLLATNDEDTIKLWDVGTGKLARTIPISNIGIVRQIVFSADGHLLAVSFNSGLDSGPIRVFATADGTLVRSFLTNGEIHSITFSPDGARLISGTHHLYSLGSRPKSLQVWSIQTGDELKSLPLANSHGQIAMLPDNRTLVVHDTNNVYFWDVPLIDER